MSGPDDFDALLKQSFDREQRPASADTFVASTMQRISTERRRTTAIRTALRAVALVAIVFASPWLIAGATHLNAALETSLTWTAGSPGAWVLGAFAVAAVLISRVRSR